MLLNSMMQLRAKDKIHQCDHLAKAQ